MHRITTIFFFFATAVAIALLLASRADAKHVFNKKLFADFKKAAEERVPGSVIETPAGNLIQILRRGDPSTAPAAGDATSRMLIDYEGKFLRDIGSEPFDSSYDKGEPATFAAKGVIACWSEIMAYLVKGDMINVACLGEYSYGDKGSPSGKVPPGNIDLHFRLELHDITSNTVDGSEARKRFKEATGVEFGTVPLTPDDD